MTWLISREPMTLRDLQEGARKAFRRDGRCMHLGQAGFCGRPALPSQGDEEPRCAEHAGRAGKRSARRRAGRGAGS